MNNEHYLIHKDDYISHIDDKFQLFMMLQGLTNLVSKLPPDEKNIPAIALAKHHRNESEKMFKTWGIPRSYVLFGSEADLAELMENELIAPEDAGFCDCECCCDEDEDEADEEEMDDEEVFAEMVAALSDVVHQIFGNTVTIQINVE